MVCVLTHHHSAPIRRIRQIRVRRFQVPCCVSSHTMFRCVETRTRVSVNLGALSASDSMPCVLTQHHSEQIAVSAKSLSFIIKIWHLIRIYS